MQIDDPDQHPEPLSTEEMCEELQSLESVLMNRGMYDEATFIGQVYWRMEDAITERAELDKLKAVPDRDDLGQPWRQSKRVPFVVVDESDMTVAVGAGESQAIATAHAARIVAAVNREGKG